MEKVVETKFAFTFTNANLRWTSRPMASSRCASSPATMTTLLKFSCSRSVPTCLLGLSFGGLTPSGVPPVDGTLTLLRLTAGHV